MAERWLQTRRPLLLGLVDGWAHSSGAWRLLLGADLVSLPVPPAPLGPALKPLGDTLLPPCQVPAVPRAPEGEL